MAVSPIFKGATELDVAEALVPAKVFDLGFPWNAERGEGKWADADGEFCAVSGGYAGVAWGVFGTGLWCGEQGFFDAGALPFGHEAWKVFGVREEGEDQLRWIGKPLFCGEGMAHLWIGYGAPVVS